MKWQKEQEEFNRRKREHEIQLVEIERQEVERREEEVRRRNEDLDEKRRKHRMIQDAVNEQVRIPNQGNLFVMSYLCFFNSKTKNLKPKFDPFIQYTDQNT